MYTQDGKGDGFITLIFVPSLEVADKLRSKLGNLGKLSSDGRPIFKIYRAREFGQDDHGHFCRVPCYSCSRWTPSVSVFGANSGFPTRMEEMFWRIFSSHIHAIETGSVFRSGDELEAFSTPTRSPSFRNSSMPIRPIAWEGRPMPRLLHSDYQGDRGSDSGKRQKEDPHTVEFFPEEGKYHYDGHRNCGVGCVSA